jgi:hypothetical protein
MAACGVSLARLGGAGQGRAGSGIYIEVLRSICSIGLPCAATVACPVHGMVKMYVGEDLRVSDA